MAEIAILHDMSRCSGCRACMVACKQWHDLPADMSTPFEGQYQSHKDLTPTTFNLIKMSERKDAEGFHWDILKFQCMHCENPACAAGCPEEAIERLESGAVVIDDEKCVGCGYCSHNCPFGVPKINKETHKSTKCDLCYDRIAEGMPPACAKTCTTSALMFGSLDEMKALAETRLNLIREQYPHANIYNPQGVGGIHMIYVLPDRPEVYGLPAEPQAPASVNLWRDIVRPVGKVASLGAIAGVLGMAAISHAIKSRAAANKKGDDSHVG